MHALTESLDETGGYETRVKVHHAKLLMCAIVICQTWRALHSIKGDALHKEAFNNEEGRRLEIEIETKRQRVTDSYDELKRNLVKLYHFQHGSSHQHSVSPHEFNHFYEQVDKWIETYMRQSVSSASDPFDPFAVKYRDQINTIKDNHQQDLQKIEAEKDVEKQKKQEDFKTSSKLHTKAAEMYNQVHELSDQFKMHGKHTESSAIFQLVDMCHAKLGHGKPSSSERVHEPEISFPLETGRR